jgi:hypothetical protein
MGNRIPKDLPGGFVGAFCNISCVTSLDLKHEFPNVGGRYSVDELVAERRENIRLQASQHAIGMAWRLADSPPFPPSSGNLLKAVFCLTLFRLGFPLFGFGLGLTISHWINSCSQHLANCEVIFAGLRKTD